MTSGTRTLNGTMSVSALPFAGPWFTYGRYFTKSWSGTDRAVTPPVVQSKIVTLTRHSAPVPVFNHKTGGVKLKTRVIGVDQVVKTFYAKTERKKASVVYAPHPYSTTGVSYNDPVILVREYPTQVPVTQSSYRSTYSEPTFTGSWGPDDDIALLGKLREAIAGSDFNAAVFLAEGREALNLIASSATKIAKSIMFARKGNFNEAMAALAGSRSLKTGRRIKQRDVAASNWLEVQYGWTPLLKDAESGAQFLGTVLNAPLTWEVRARKKFVHGVTNPAGAYTSFPSAVAITKGQIIATLTEVDKIALAGLYDPLSVIWEKTPYSFVVDWFLPIGQYLSARGLIQSIKGTFVTTKKFDFRSGAPVWIGSSPNFYCVGGDLGSFTLKRWNFSRSVSDSLSVPMPSLKGFNQAASWRHCTSAIALLTQQLGSLKHLRSAHAGRYEYTE